MMKTKNREKNTIYSHENTSIDTKYLVILGPFNDMNPGLEKTVFYIHSRIDKYPLVPSTRLILENMNIVGIYVHDMKYYIVYETNKPENYREYLASIPEGAKPLSSIEIPRCPRCGNWNIVVDADEMYCPRCKLSDFWHTEKIWEPREHDLGKALTGYGVAWIEDVFARKTSKATYDIVIETSRDREKIGNVEVEYREGLGYIIWYHYDEPPTYVFKQIRIYNYRGEEYVKQIRDLNTDELLKISEKTEKRDILLEIFLELLERGEREKAVELALKKKLYYLNIQKYIEKYDLKELKKTYIDYKVEEMMKSFNENKLEKAKNYAEEILNDPTAPREAREKAKLIIEKYNEALRRERIKHEEEKRRSIEEFRKQLENTLSGLPIVINIRDNIVEVKLTKYVDRNVFNKFVEECKKLGMKFEPTTKTWIKHFT